MEPVLTINNYSLSLRASDGRVLPVLEEISLKLNKGTCVGLAGESGSGKTMLACSIMGLVPSRSIVKSQGSIAFKGIELVGLAENRFRQIRGPEVAMVFQEPMTSLNPLITIFNQVAEVVSAHRTDLSRDKISEMVRDSLLRAGFSEPEKFWNSYPHQLSGGMRQRAMLAVSLVLQPELVIADEPTTALDAALQLQLLEEMKREIRDFNRSMIFISHDLGVLHDICDQMAVMYAGFILEYGPASRIFKTPAHPYTAALMKALPRLTKDRAIPSPIPGSLPSPDSKPAGCVFNDRCSRAAKRCFESRPDETSVGDDHMVRCFLPCVEKQPGDHQ